MNPCLNRSPGWIALLSLYQFFAGACWCQASPAAHRDRSVRYTATKLGTGAHVVTGPAPARAAVLQSDARAGRLQIQRLIDELGTPKEDDAIRGLARIGPAAVDPLIQAMYRRPYVWRALGRMGAPAVYPLIHAFRRKGGWEFGEPERALAEIGPPALRPLLRALDDPDGTISACAVGTLGLMRDARAAGPLIQVLHRQRHWVEGVEVSEALVGIGAPALVRVFPLLHSRREAMREGAWSTLEVAGENPDLLPLLLRYLSSPDATYRRGAVVGLGSIVWFLPSPDADGVGPSSDTRSTGNRVRLALLDALQDPSPGVRLAAVYAVSHFTDPLLHSALRRCLSDSNALVRLAARQVGVSGSGSAAGGARALKSALFSYGVEIGRADRKTGRDLGKDLESDGPTALLVMTAAGTDPHGNPDPRAAALFHRIMKFPASLEKSFARAFTQGYRFGMGPRVPSRASQNGPRGEDRVPGRRG